MKKITMLFFVTLTTLLMGASGYAQYCTPEGTNAARYINDFTTTSGGQNISNLASGFSTGGYGDFTSLIVEQGPGGSISFEVNIMGGTAGFRIWVDWNQDGQFDVANEVAYQSTSYKSNHTGSLTVPVGAQVGPTRMRVVSHWLNNAGLIDPCITGFTYGEFEDYTFNVSATASWDCPALEANVGDACDDGDAGTANDTLNESCECVGIPVASNDEACTATDLTCGGIVVQTLIGATSSMTDACYGSGSSDVWFSFTSDGSQMLTVSEDSALDAVVQLFVGDACGDIVEYGACKDSPENYTITEAGTYYFRVRPYFSSDDEGEITVSLVCVDYDCPAELANIGDACDDGDSSTINDVIGEDCGCAGVPPAPGSICDNAIALDCNAGPATFSSAAANGTNTTSCSMGNNGLWFSFTGTGGDITVNSTATFDHEMSINSGLCDDLTNITCRDGSTGAETYTIAPSVDGQQYYVYVAHYSAGSIITGDITISIECATPPACSPPSLDLAVQDASGNPIADCLNVGSEYYVLATLSGGEGNTSYNVSANSGDPVAVNADDSVVLGPFAVGVNVSVTAIGVQDGDCDISVSIDSPAVCPPTNENCESAIALSCDDSVQGTTVGATYSGTTDNCTSRSSGDVYYTLDVNEGDEYTVTVVGADYDAVLAIYTGSCTGLTELTCADNGFVDGAEETITFTAAATETVVIRTYDWSSSAGSFTISVACSPLSIKDDNMLSGTHLFPNPLNDNTFFVHAPKLNGERVEVKIADLAGRQIFNNTLLVNDSKVTVSLDNGLTSGVYLVTLKHLGESHTYRLVKE